MGFRDYPFLAKNPDEREDRDPRRFPGHAEVLAYSEEFLLPSLGLVRFGTEVLFANLVGNGKWKVRSKKRGDHDDDDEVGVEEVFDAVVVCNGHYTLPRIAEIHGTDKWPGKQMHSHNYRIPEPFRDQVVICIGSSASAADISRDIARVAKEVHIASRSALDGTTKRHPSYDNIWLHSMVKLLGYSPMIERVHEDGSVAFQDVSVIFADVILHCTGRVGPLYKHIFPPASAPGLSFAGLPWKVVPFAMFEYQSKWIAGALSGRLALPSVEEMVDNISSFTPSSKFRAYLSTNS